MIRFIAAVGLALLAAPASAQPREEPVGCGAFKWSLDSERVLLRASGVEEIASGAEIGVPLRRAVSLGLLPGDKAGLPMSPERPRGSPNDKAGFVRIQAPAQAGPYRITISEAGWIDVIQNGRMLRAGAFSGATGCEGLRKSVTFDLAAAPFIVQFSGVPADRIRLVMTAGAP